MSDAWIESIRSTGKVGELLELSRRYVATWEPARIAALPPECRPGPLLTSDELSSYALTLVRREFARDTGVDHACLGDMGNFFAAAAVRLAEILAISRGISGSRAFLRPVEIDEP